MNEFNNVILHIYIIIFDFKMNKLDYHNPEQHIFYCDKSDWYNEVDGKKDWSKGMKKVDEFWEKIRIEKMAKEDFDFSYVIFPTFSMNSFWMNNENHKFSGRVSFSVAKFLGKASLGAQFSREVTFFRTQFLGETSFFIAKFLGEAAFKRTQFSGKTSFGGSQFSGNAIFDDAKFSENASFENVRFSGNTSFSWAKFIGETKFTSCIHKKVDFRGTKFSIDNHTLFDKWVIIEEIMFENVHLTDKVLFQGCDMQGVSFIESNIVNAEFSNCDFMRIKNRIVLSNDKVSNYKDLARAYRQIKVNQMNAKDWANAGDAYRSEMVMKKKLIEQEIKQGQWHKLVNWLVMSFYQSFSGYNQSLSRPWFWLLLLWFMVPATLANIDNNVEPADKVFSAIKTSFDAAIPLLGKIDTKGYPDWVYYLLAFERIFTLILLTFFGLATRARLRQ